MLNLHWNKSKKLTFLALALCQIKTLFVHLVIILWQGSKQIKNLSSGKAPAADCIPAEIYTSSGPKLIETHTILFNSMWSQEKLPQEFKDASIVHLYKHKGNRYACDNHYSMASSCTPLLGRFWPVSCSITLLNTWNAACSPKVSVVFTRDTAPLTWSCCLEITRKCKEQSGGLFTTFVDLTKGFNNTVCSEGLWKIMVKFGYPDQLIAVVQPFHDGMNVRVQENGE